MAGSFVETDLSVLNSVVGRPIVQVAQDPYEKLTQMERYGVAVSLLQEGIDNQNGESLIINLDSIMDEFRGYFNEETPYKWKKDFSYFPDTDSLFMKDFFTDDYFFRNWQEHQDEIEKMIKKMDSSRNAFLRKYHPGLIGSGKEEKL